MFKSAQRYCIPAGSVIARRKREEPSCRQAIIRDGDRADCSETFTPAGNKVVHMALDLPKETKITGVRACYELSNPRTYISQIRLAQVQDPPAIALVLLDDGTDLTDPGPVCVNSASTWIRSADGSVLLSRRVFFGDTSDAIVVRALGLLVK